VSMREFLKRRFIDILAIAGASIAPSANAAQHFIDQEFGVTFSYPDEWQNLPARTGLFRVQVGEKDAMGGSCMLSVNVVPQLANVSEEQMVKETEAKHIEAGARVNSPNFRVTHFERTRIMNRPAVIYQATSTFQSLQLKLPMKTVAGTVKAGNKLVTLGCTSYAPTFELQKPTFHYVIGSLLVRSR
jgi:hypothetical protein